MCGMGWSRCHPGGEEALQSDVGRDSSIHLLLSLVMESSILGFLEMEVPL